MRMAVAVVLLGLAVAATPARATVTQYWTVETPEEFLKAKGRGVALGGAERAEAGPQIDSLGDVGEPVIWAVLHGPDGSIYAGTGHNGKIFRGAAGHALRAWATVGDAEVLSLAADGSGGVYAGTGPKGKIFHIDREGRLKPFASVGAEYVWALLRDRDGSLFAATGAQGRIYHVSPSGASEEYWDSPAGHVVCLAFSSTHTLLAGGEEEGVVYELTGKGKGRALFDSGEHEIHSIAVAPGGDIYVAALKVALQLPGSSSGASVSVSSSGASGSSGGARSAVYRLLPNGAGVKVWDGPGLVYSLECVGGSIYAATGEPSQLLRIESNGDAMRLAELDAGSILSTDADGKSLYLGTGNPGQIYRVNFGARAGSARLESSVLDGKRVARWGELSFEGEGASGVRFLLRSGNSDPPDKSWSEWEPYRGGNITAPAGRYLQWRAELPAGAGLRRVRVAYREQNLPPEVRSVQILPDEPRALLGTPDNASSITQTLPNGVKVEYSLPRQAQRPQSFDVSGWARGIRHVRWEASDPNGDPLQYSIDYRARGERTWKPLARGLDETIYAWDTTSLPDDPYEIRVTASDSTLNVPSEALSTTRVSEVAVIDHTPPRWQNLGATREAGGRLRVRGTAVDDLSPLVYLGYSVDGGDWILAEPEDGVLDSPRESVSFETLPVPPGEHTVMVKAVDLSGNIGSAAAIVR